MVHYKIPQLPYSVIPAKAGIHMDFSSNYLQSLIKVKMDSRFASIRYANCLLKPLRENDG